MKAVISDIDGTVALNGDRPVFAWDRVAEDTPNTPIIELVRLLALTHAAKLFFITGRPESCRADTEAWLNEHIGVPFELHMRPDEKRIPNQELKVQFFSKHVNGKYDVVFALDDMSLTSSFWRRCGVQCLQVADDPRD